MAPLGGQSLSGIGFGIGVDRTLLACRAEGVAAVVHARCEVFGVPLGDAAHLRLVVISAALRRAGVRTDMAYGGRGLKGAMKAADRSGARSRWCSAIATSTRARRRQGHADGRAAAVPLDAAVDAELADRLG